MKATRSALLKWLARSLVKCIPMGEAVSDFATDVLPLVANDAYEWWRGEASAEQRRADLETLATESPEEAKADAAAAVAEAAKELDCDPSPELLSAVQQYLEQVPDAIRRSMRRPEDSRGLTVPPHLMPRSATELAALLPQRPPRFRAGDRPIPGVDLELVAPLGAGGFGEVWRARKTHLGQDVALKFCLDPTASQSLRNETALLRRLMTGDAMHPGIVRLLATYNDCTALEYEFVEGGDLAGVIRDWHGDGRRPRPRDVIDAIRQVAEIVAFAHALSPPLVHRDLKPANILVSRKRDGTLRFRLTDFGIGGVAKDAKHLASGKTINASTTSIHGSYSALYASPQQMRAEPPAPTDDVFSLGVIFWQLANGDLGDGVPGGTAWAKELEAEGYPADVVALIASCFDRRADRRPATAGAFVEALTKTSPPPLPPPARPAMEPARAIVEPAKRVAEPIQPPRVGPGPAPRPPMQAPRSKKTLWIVLTIALGVLLLACVTLALIGIAVQQEDAGDDDGATADTVQTPAVPTGSGAGDQFVNTVPTARGPASVVRNGGDYFLTQPDGPRVRIFYNEATGAWSYAN